MSLRSNEQSGRLRRPLTGSSMVASGPSMDCVGADEDGESLTAGSVGLLATLDDASALEMGADQSTSGLTSAFNSARIARRDATRFTRAANEMGDPAPLISK